MPTPQTPNWTLREHAAVLAKISSCPNKAECLHCQTLETMEKMAVAHSRTVNPSTEYSMKTWQAYSALRAMLAFL
jgi:hypothetical protein